MLHRLFIVFALSVACVPARAQTATPGAAPVPAASPTSAPAFIRADVRPSPWITYPYTNGDLLRGERYTLRQATMVDLISKAWSLDPSTVAGGPSWLEFDRFDIVAQAPAGTPPATLKLMLRSLLTDRFGLVAHNGTVPMPAWVLTAVKPKLTAAQSSTTECVPIKPPVSGSAPMVAVACHNMPMDQFVSILQDFGVNYFENKPVVDSTGLTDKYDFEFHWTPYGLLARAGGNGITIFDAMTKQLGLKLDFRIAPRSVFIVDNVRSTPTPNAPGIDKALPPEPPAHFEVAVIKPSKPDEEPGGTVDFDHYDLQGDSLKSLIQFAWNLDLNDDGDVVGLPKWADSDRYDIQAKVSPEDLDQVVSGTRQVEYERARQMLQTLLIERFGIQAHMEERPVTAYNFEATGPQLKPELKPADPAERTKCGHGPGPGEKDPSIATPILNRVVHCRNITLAEFGRELPHLAYGYLNSPVVDDTGLHDRYDFTLSFSSADLVKPGSGESSGGAPLPPGDPNGAISLYDAVRRELGLRLLKVRRSAPVLVIDHVNREPSAN